MKLERQFIHFTNEYLSIHKLLPKYCEIKTFYDTLKTSNSKFKASKGWFEKFIWRNYKMSPRYHYRKVQKSLLTTSPKKMKKDSLKRKTEMCGFSEIDPNNLQDNSNKKPSILRTMENALERNNTKFFDSEKKKNENHALRFSSNSKNSKNGDIFTGKFEMLNLSKLTEIEIVNVLKSKNQQTNKVEFEQSNNDTMPMEFNMNPGETDKECCFKNSIFENQYFLN